MVSRKGVLRRGREDLHQQGDADRYRILLGYRSNRRQRGQVWTLPIA